MTPQQSPTGKKQEENPLLGCGFLVVILLLIVGLAASCFGGSDEPAEQALPTAPPWTTPRSAPPTTTSSAPVRAYEQPAPAQSIADRDCPDFSSQAEAQAALLPGDPERLDPDDDGIACENYSYGSDYDQPEPYIPAPQAPAEDDNSGGGNRPRSRNSGHPCLPGERDGDGDGYCGEGR